MREASNHRYLGSLGRRVRTLLDQANPSAGWQRAVWDFTGDAGQSLSGGEYIYRVTIDDIAESRIIRRKR